MKTTKTINMPALDLNIPKTYTYTIPSQVYLRPADYKQIITTPSSHFYDIFLQQLQDGLLFNKEVYIKDKAMYLILLNYVAAIKIDSPIKNTDYFSSASGMSVRLYFDIATDKFSIEIPYVQDVYYDLPSFTAAHESLSKILTRTDSRHLFMTTNVLEISLKIAWLPLIKSE